MNVVSNLVNAVGSFYTELNPSTLSGAIDIIVVRDKETLVCSPFHVRFGKLKLLRPSEQLVSIMVNQKLVDIQMKMGEAGEAFFTKYPNSPDLQAENNPEVLVDSDSLDPVNLDADWKWNWGDLPEIDPLTINESPSRDLNKRSSSPILKSKLDPGLKFNPVNSPLSNSPPLSSHLASLDITSNALSSSPPPSRPIDIVPSSSPINISSNTRIPSDPVSLPINVSGSLPNSPSSVLSVFEDYSENNVAISLCGPLEDLQNLSPQVSPIEQERHYHTWKTAAPCIISRVAFGKPLSLSAIDGLVSESTRPSGSLNFMKSWWSSPPKRTLPHASTNLGLVRPISPPLPSAVAEPTNATPPVEKKQHFAKSLRMTSDQLKSLNLNPGPNTITFSVTSSLQGIQTCSARIFLWESDSLIVISDIDGTITKYCIFNRRSDVLGHVFNMVGKDWTHNGVASLYSRIANNGFKFLYLSSRAIGQAQSTREYLDKIEQDRQQLPQGPVLLSPDRLIRALTREVVLRKPEEFKIACLRDIKKLFEKNPFFAGFGNRITDALAYRSVDIPISRIYTVDPKGDLKLDLVTFFKSSYTNLKETVDQVFPPNKQMGSYNDFNYWKPEVVTLQISSDSSDSEYENSDEEFDLEHLKDVPY